MFKVVRAPLILFTLLFAGCTAEDLDGPASSAPQDEAEQDEIADEVLPEPDTSWAVPPSQIGVGSIIEGTIVCGFFETSIRRQFTFDGELWNETTPMDDAAATTMREGTEACVTEGIDKYLDWYVDADGLPFMYVSGGLHHDLRPSVAENIWNGRVYPVGEPSEDCLAALEVHGLSLPVVLLFTVDAVQILQD